MIAWSIETARKSGCFERILVSTDDEEIAAVAREYGAEAPFLRPGELADDYTPMRAVVRHALEWALMNWGPVEAFCNIYPTAPMLSPATLIEGMALVTGGRFRAAWAMVRIPYPVYQIMIITEQGAVERLFSDEKVAMRSQDMPPAFIDVGQAYCFDTTHYLRHGAQVGPELAVVEVPQESAVDIDTEEDWDMAEIVVRRLWESSWTVYKEDTGC